MEPPLRALVSIETEKGTCQMTHENATNATKEKETVFPSKKSERQQTTYEISREIIAAETAAREAKSARLRKQRLARDTREAAEAGTKPAPKRKKSS